MELTKAYRPERTASALSVIEEIVFCNNSVSDVAELCPGCLEGNDASPLQQTSQGNVRIRKPGIFGHEYEWRHTPEPSAGAGLIE